MAVKIVSKWIALSHDMKTVLAEGIDLKEVYESAKMQGENEPIMYKVIPQNIKLVL